MTAIVYIRRLTALLVSNLILLMLLGCGGSGDDGNGAAGHSSRLALTLTTAGETLNSRQLGSVSTARAEPGDQDFVTLIKIIVSADDIDPPIIEFFEVPKNGEPTVTVELSVLNGKNRKITTLFFNEKDVKINEGQIIIDLFEDKRVKMEVPSCIPTITNPGSQSDFEGDPVALQIEAKSPIDLPLTYSADDDTLPPGLRIDPADGKISGTLLAAGTYVVTVTVSDDGPRTASTAFKWTVKPFRPPIDIITPEDQSNFEGDAVSLQIKAKSASGLPLTYSDDDDTLPPGLSIDPADGKISGTLLAAGTYVVTVTVTDGSDTTSTAFKWTVKPFRPPIDIITPEDQSNFEGDAVSLQIKAKSASGLPLTYSDDDDTLPPGLSIDPADGKISGTLLAAGTYVVTVTVTDGSDTTSTAFKWTVKPFRPPIDIITPEDQSNFEGDAVSLQIKAKSASGLPLTYSDDDDTLPPGLSIDPADGKISGTLLAAGTYVVTVTVTDGSDTTSTAFKWTVKPFRPPIDIITPEDQSNFEGDAVSLQIKAKSASGLPLTYSDDDDTLPPGLSIDPADGKISGTLLAAGTYVVTVTVTDGSDTTSTAFKWTVKPFRPPIDIITPEDQSNFEGDAVSLQIKAKSASGLPLTYSDDDDTLPPGLSIDPADGKISGTLLAAGTYVVTVTVTDGSDTASTAFRWTVASPPPPPECKIINPGPQSNFEGDAVALQIVAAGECDSYSAVNLPDGLDIDEDSGLISGIIAADTSGTYGVTVTVVEDESGRTDSTTFTWTVARVVDPGPTIINPGPQRNFEGDTVSLQIKAKSASGLALTYSAVNLPDDLDINEVTGLIFGTIDADTSGTYGVTVTVDEDESGRTDSTTFTWTVARVVDPGPTIINPGDQRNFEGETVSLQIKAKSASGLALTYSADNLPDDLDIKKDTGLIFGTLAEGTSGTYGVTVTVVEDESGRTDSTTFTWTVARVVDPGPTIINPGPQRNFEGDTVSLQIKAKSASGLALTYSAVNLPDDLDINEVTGLIFGTIDADTSGTYGVTVTVVEDESGRTDSTTFTWTVARVVDPGPTIINPGDQRNFEGDTVSLQIKAKSASGLALTYRADNLPDDLDIKKDTGLIFGTLAEGTSGTYGVTVTVVEDESGRTDSTTFTWTVARVVDPGPTIINPGDQRNFEGDTVSLQIKAKSASGLALTYRDVNLPEELEINEVTGLISGTIAEGTSDDSPYGVTVTVVEDESGRTDSTTFTWTVARVVDPGPTIINPGDQRNFEGDTVSLQIKAKSVSGLALTYRDVNLPEELEINEVTGLISGTIAEGTSDDSPYGVTVTVVEDESGRTDSTTFTWTVARVVDPGPTIINPGDQRNFEGDTVSLQIKAKSASGLALTYRDDDTLPEELEINEVTGLISGTIAEGTSDDSPYGVTVTVVEDESGRTDSTTFTWTVARVVDPGPTIINPGDQRNFEGDTVSLQIKAKSASGLALTYRDDDTLPEELEINEVTGLISGTIAEGTSDDSPYGVTVTVVEDESGRTDSTTFTWTVGRCTLEPMEGRIIIQLGPSFLCSPQEGGSCVGQSTSIPVNPLIPSGIYDVTLESFDDHSGQSPPHGQMNESYFLRLRNQNDLKIVDTNAIGDLPDNMDQKTQIVNTDLFVEDAIGSIIAIHFCDDSTGNNCALSPNSIDPVCVSFDLVEEGITDLPMGE